MRKRFETVWAIRPEAIGTVARLVSREMAGSSAPVQTTGGDGKTVLAGSSWEAPVPSTKGAQGNKTAIIPIQGVLTSDGPRYYGSNYSDISAAVEKAVSDPDIARIILSVDSPGGEVTGLPETAAIIAKAAKMKPVTAMVEGAAASAAYWLASQAGDITVTPSGEVGSVGVRMMHVDMSGALEADGIKVTELHSGDYKTEWSPYHPLSDDAKANMNARIQANHADFIADVSRGRGARASTSIRAARFGEGRMFSSKAALENGMVDKVQATRDFYASVTASKPAPRCAGRSVQRARLELEKLRTV